MVAPSKSIPFSTLASAFEFAAAAFTGSRAYCKRKIQIVVWWFLSNSFNGPCRSDWQAIKSKPHNLFLADTSMETVSDAQSRGSTSPSGFTQ